MLAAAKIIDRQTREFLNLEPKESAQIAGLRYVRADTLQIKRKKVGRGFSYLDANGDRITDKAALTRIKALAIPPALTEVKICHLANGHLQATGRDGKRRKQYFYHPQWRKIRSQHKFNRMLLFGAYLPQIRQTAARHLRKHGLPKEKVLATVVRLLETTLIRVGNDHYARKNDSFGLTTLRDRHVDINGSKVRFEFRGKSGVDHEIELSDRRLATIIKRCQEIPGYEIFKYYDCSGDRHFINSEDVNQYLQDITKQEFTAKDFRTWAGTLLAATELQKLGDFDSEQQAQSNIATAVKKAAKRLGNRPATCRKYYIHPVIIEAYQNGLLLNLFSQKTKIPLHNEQLNPEEAIILQVIKKDLALLNQND
ncbi:topoisomerase IB [Xenococcus sp. PCC 7305]|uniref:DNA topoisomerase IB n=1 Tax=Xenococcus sp. PCC 7305 TaxID=102125 RepID=UPI0002ABF5EC|nr:DNA topoisomerase IB [Xenococcus sp. PCC 7305]ELS04258.1 topoisomerase IB [Xenococcus sp. PCC 7305]